MADMSGDALVSNTYGVFPAISGPMWPNASPIPPVVGPVDLIITANIKK
jgi:hypothetical protein